MQRISEYFQRSESKKEQGKIHKSSFGGLYLGICRYEQNEYKEAIESFEKALKLYPKFSDAQMYEAICLKKLNQIEQSNSLIKIAKKNGLSGFTINEDNAIYERYPYQISARTKIIYI